MAKRLPANRLCADVLADLSLFEKKLVCWNATDISFSEPNENIEKASICILVLPEDFYP